MNLLLRFYFLCLLTVANTSDNETVEYFVDLVNEQIPRAYTYPLPQDSSEFIPESDDVTDYGTFDYVIVGAGSAGAVIANRLTEVRENEVLLLEAGGHENDFSDIPGMGNFLLGLEFNWNYNSTTQRNVCQGMLNRQCAYPRGRGLGGSSIINGLIYARGNKRDYDNWANQGNPGWSYDEVLPYFKKAEHSHIDGDEGYHGKDGPLHVEYITPNTPQYYAFIEANLELGRQFIDYNGREQLGVGRTQFNNIHGRRDSTGKAYILPASNRPNLKILPYSLATKILIKPISRRAHGVVFSNSRQLFKANARKEVIVSAGVIGSPQLLMLSGIGPALHLLSHGIPVIQPLAVGDNLHDHTVYFALNFQTNYMEPVRTTEEYVESYLHASGPLTGNSQGIAFVQTNVSTVPGYPDIELLLNPSNNTGSYIERAFHLTQETYNSTFQNVDPTRCFSVNPMILRPKSRGTLRLRSRDPYDYPLIDPMALSDPEGKDIETLYQGIQLALQVANTNAFRKLNATLLDATHPACRNLEYLSKPYWYCQIRYLSNNIFHPVGTCKMGPSPLTGAVVNQEGKVYGIKNLRVADASIVPDIVCGHLNAPAIMIGEKIAEMIKKQNNLFYYYKQKKMYLSN